MPGEPSPHARDARRDDTVPIPEHIHFGVHFTGEFLQIIAMFRIGGIPPTDHGTKRKLSCSGFGPQPAENSVDQSGVSSAAGSRSPRPPTRIVHANAEPLRPLTLGPRVMPIKLRHVVGAIRVELTKRAALRMQRKTKLDVVFPARVDNADIGLLTCF